MSIEQDVETVRKGLEPFASPFNVEPARQALDRILARITELEAEQKRMQDHHAEAENRVAELEEGLRRILEEGPHVVLSIARSLLGEDEHV